MSPATTKRKPAKKAVSKRTKPTASIQQISPCLWFDGQAEEAARFYVSVFPKGKITQVTRYPEVGQEVHHRPAGSVMTVEFVLNGLPFLALNGGPLFKFNEAVSLMILCDTQDEIDYYWDKLSEGGDPNVQACGWLKDKYGLSWQVVPKEEMKLWKDHKSPATRRAFAAMMDMKKLDIAKLKAAYKG
ncbi:MAG TPA: VOC family protein [Usitatibacter sp.]|nr:VOC family protein [Usitatibacter sp.]